MAEKTPIGVAGVGTMGTGIAIVAARGGFPTILFDLDGRRVEDAIASMRAFFGKSVQRGKLTQDQVKEIMSRVRGTSTIEDLSTCGLVGAAPPSDLVEIVRQPATPEPALTATRELFGGYGLKTAVCADFPGRIVDRLVRPYYNAALNRLDAGLATATDLDLTLKLGLGYPEGPIELLKRTGLEAHYDVTSALFAVLAGPAYTPARRAHNAKVRADVRARSNRGS